jgi:ATP-binding cassette, subfamily C, bacterial CydD
MGCAMKPFDPRLIHHARSTRPYLVATTALSVAAVTLIIGQADLLATAISRVFLSGAAVADLRGTLVALAVVIALRAAVAWGQEITAHRGSAAVKTELRSQLLAHVLRLGPAWLADERSGEVATLATRGLDALDAYYARYLPQLLLAALVPATVLAWIVPADLVAGLTILVTLPLIPLFMALVGSTTEARNRQQFAALSRLAHHLLELIAGLPTLKVFGRAKAQAQVIREITENQRRLTMRTLRLAFLSSLVLELLATLSVALVAVGIGLRLVNGSLELKTALLVLILAPEAYLPLRQLGVHYHASAEGVAAASAVFAILETRPPRAGTGRELPDPRLAALIVDEVAVCYAGRSEPALAQVSLRIEPGELVAITGPSGCGKSTLLNVLLGFTRPTRGKVLLGDGPTATDLAEIDPDYWRAQLAYVPQRPYLFPGTVAQNIALGCDQVEPGAVSRAAYDAGLDDLAAGVSTVVGEGGAGLSAGQRQRVALARALLRNAPVMVLDEPTASLDADIEADIVARIRRLAPTSTVILVAHRPALAAVADRVFELRPAAVAV